MGYSYPLYSSTETLCISYSLDRLEDDVFEFLFWEL